MSVFLSSLGFGIISAAVLAIATVGFTMQFAVTNVLNLAYGSVMINSAFVTYYLNAHLGLNAWVALLGGVATGSVASYLLNRFVYTPFQRRHLAPITIVIVALGVDLCGTFGLQAIVGGSYFSYRQSLGREWHVLGMYYSTLQLTIIAIALGVMLAVAWLLKYTRLGKAMRATSANPNLARNSGVRTDRVISTTWLISGALAGLAGTVFAMNTGVFEATSAQLYIVLLLAAMFLGGPGEPYGAMLGAAIIGVATELSAAFINPQYKMVIAFVILLGMLMFRPFGLFGSERTA
ncbi:MAG TPA: branched-chain amino acid ABC transporter permease [Acidimicrobiales bacterium]|nr:branched-chain amino acid ABC transporter permease [Acidimicrobiales bacterium]